MEKILHKVQEPGADALYIWRDGEVLTDWHSTYGDRPIDTMSVTKSIVNLAIGRLVYTGKLPTIDLSVCELFAEWRGDSRREITIRHLLSQTSGLASDRTTEKIYASPDIVRFALEAELATAPGTRFFYNNRATNLLAGVVERASGRKLDDYMAEEIFSALGISEWSWTRDSSGNPYAMSELALRAADLAKLGRLMLDGGVADGTRILDKTWVDESSRPGQPFNSQYGLLWWLIPESAVLTIDDSVVAAWCAADPPVDEAFISRVLPLKDKPFTRETFFPALSSALGVEPTDEGLAEWYTNTRRRGLPDGKLSPSRIVGIYAQGDLGQYLVVLKKERLIAVHQRTGQAAIRSGPEFIDMLRRAASGG